MDNAREGDFVPVYALGFFHGNPASRSFDFSEGITSADVAGMMTAFLDNIIDNLDDQHQLQFEEEVLDYFNVFMEKRYENSSKYKINIDHYDTDNDF